MAIAKIQTGDNVKITTGAYKGTIGQVTSVQKKRTKKSTIIRASVMGVPKIAKFKKAFNYGGQSYPGSVQYIDRFIDVSNLSQITEEGALSKVKIVFSQDGKKTRVLKKNQTIVQKTPIANLTENTEDKSENEKK